MKDDRKRSGLHGTHDAEIKPLHDGVKRETDSNTYAQSGPSSLRKTVDYRRRLFHTTVFYFANFGFGWVLSQRGAAFLDLLLVTDTDVAKGSILFVLDGLASIVGGMAGGFLLDATGRPLHMMAIVFAVNAVVNSVLALCKHLALMSTCFFMSNFALAVHDIVVNSHLASIWPVKGGDGFLQGLHFIFAVGAVLSPLATQPFLAPHSEDADLIPIEETDREFRKETERNDSMINHEYVYDLQNQSMVSSGENFDHATDRETNVFYALLISGSLCLFISILMCVLLLLPIEKLKQSEKCEDNGKLPDKERKVYHATLLMLGVFNFFGSSVEEVFPLYLMTFVVRALDWTKASGAHINSVFWVGLLIGRLSGVALVRILSPTKIILGCLVFMTASLLALLLAVSVEAHWAVWISIGAMGLSTALIFPTGLIYAHKKVAQLTGKVAAIIFTSPMIAAMADPIIVATLMTGYDDLCYIYVFLLQTVLAVCSFFVLHTLSRRLSRSREKSHDVQIELEDSEDRGKSQAFLENPSTIIS